MNDLLALPRVAIVGSRKPTPYGILVTEKFASELARAGVVIISGLAFGVDITAHKAAVAAGGRSIAVLPSGLNKIYPATHAKIARSITENGAIISEYESSHRPMAHDFLDRNRLIAGLSDIVIVTEAAEKSGSLNTASHAMKMHIPIAAVPGAITSPMSNGANWLLKQGAKVVTSSEDILSLLHVQKQPTLPLYGGSDLETVLLKAIGETPCDSTQLCHLVEKSLSEVQVALTMLELAGMITSDAVGIWHTR